MKKSRIARRIAAVESPGVRSLPLVELLVETKAAELMIRSGLRVLDLRLEEDRQRCAVLGMRTVPSEVVLGGRKVAVHRPRVRGDGREVPLPRSRRSSVSSGRRSALAGRGRERSAEM